jgi:nucleotide-binding universal stress UspA family protein
LVVPPDAGLTVSARPLRALFPLEGTEQSSGAVTDVLHRLAAAGVELVGVHVFAGEVPAFWDQPAHAQQSWADQFVGSWCAESGIDLHLRRGSPAETIIAVAGQQQVDLLVLGWSQDMGPGRAEVVRATLAGAHLPVLLVPTPEDPERDT